MRRANLLCSSLSLILLYLYCCLSCSVVCYLIKINMTQSIDLGFNNVLEDVCDYRDYSNVTTKSKVNGLTVLQHNIRGVLGKTRSVKIAFEQYWQ